MSSAIQNLMHSVLGDAARTSKFEALFQFTNLQTAPESTDLLAMIKTASFPGKQHTTIDLRYKGRSIPIKGQTKYTQTWECTFYLTDDHKLKNAFENWVEALDQKHNYLNPSEVPNLEQTQRIHASAYVTNINIYQRNFDDTTNTAEYILFNVFPTEVSQVEANYESVGTISEFTVTFAYSHYQMQVMKGQSGNFIDTFVAKAQSAADYAISGTLSAIGDSINSFVKDAIGNSLNELNDFANGLSTNIIPQKSQKTVSELISGGLGPEFMTISIQDKAMQTANSSLSSFTNHLPDVAGSVEDALATLRSKV